MDPNTWQRARDIFHGVVELPGDQQDEFLDRACSDDAELRQLLDTLLDTDRELVERSVVPQIVDPGELPNAAHHPGGALTMDPDSFVGRTLGRYEIVDRVGEGGMAVVYGARQLEPFVRRVAVKILRRSMHSRELVARFAAERQSLAIMEHANIAKILDAGATPGGRPYFVMEYVDGLPITAYCRAHGLSLRNRLSLFSTICHAVRHAHARGVLHRDLKPSNVLVKTTDGEAIPIVIDFGIAKPMETLTQSSFATENGATVGTPGYMSPEQAVPSGEPLDVRADVFSLGVVLFELLTGSLPYDPDSPWSLRRIECPPAVAERLEQASPAGWPIRATEVTRSLDRIVTHAIQPNADERCPSVAALAAVVDRFLEDSEPSAGRLKNLTKRALRRRYWLAAGVVAALLFIVVLVIAAGLSQRTRNPVDLADSVPQLGLAAPSIVVLPLVDLSGEPTRDPLTVSIAVDLITRLSKFRDILVIDPTSSMSYRSSSVDLRKVANELDVRYVLHGTLQRSGERLRVSARLVEPQTRRPLWTEDFDANLTDVFDVQDDITSAIAAELNVRLLEGDQGRLWRRSTSSVAAYETFAQALELTYRMSPEAIREAIRLYEKAIELDPAYAQAYAMMGMALTLEYRFDWSSSPEEAYERMTWAADRALSLDSELPMALTVRAYVHLAHGEVDEALAIVERATELGPGSSLARAVLASTLIYADQPQRALAEIQRAIRLAPFHPDWYNGALGNAYRQLGRYDLAVEAYQRALMKMPDFLTARIRLVATLVEAGRLDEARQAAHQLRLFEPRFEVDQVTGSWGEKALPYRDPREREKLAAALRSVGIE